MDAQTKTDAPRNDVAPAARLGPFMSNVRWIAGVILLLLVSQNLVAKPFYIPSVSMMPTLLTGDRLIVGKYPYGWSWASVVPRIVSERPGRILGALPERGDIVTVTPPGHSSDYIKRVIGLPGETIEVRRGVVFIDGTPVKRRYAGKTDIPVDPNTTCTEDLQIRHRETDADGSVHCRLPIYRETLPNGRSYDTIDLGYFPEIDDFGPIRIPAGRVFLMGDNRDQSADSRVSLRRSGLGGAVPVENISGRAEFITFSLTGEAWPFLRGGRTGSNLHAGTE